MTDTTSPEYIEAKRNFITMAENRRARAKSSLEDITADFAAVKIEFEEATKKLAAAELEQKLLLEAFALLELNTVAKTETGVE